MKEVNRYCLYKPEGHDRIHPAYMRGHASGEYVKFRDYEQLQARIKELESQSHINEIKAQGINEAILHAKEFLFMPEEDINDYLALNCTLSNIKNYANKLRARTNGK